MSLRLIVIGGGPGGYVASLRAAQLGARVTLVEAAQLGGVCLNVGCVPTKALLRSAEVYRTVSQAAQFGVQAGAPRVDWPAMQARKTSAVSKLVGGVQMLLQRAGVEIVAGQARFAGPQQVIVDGAGGGRSLAGDRFVIATGSSPVRPQVSGLDLPGVIDSTGALALDTLPASLLIVGGGAIGIEFATMFAALDVQVTVVEMLPRLASLFDRDVSEALRVALLAQKVRVLLNTTLTNVEATPEGKLCARLQGPHGEMETEAEKILLAIGRRPEVDELGLEVTGVASERKGIQVDERMATSVPHIYAVGDVVGRTMLAHTAMREGTVAVENALGHAAQMNYSAIPSCIFSSPEAACVGLTEEKAREQGYDVLVGRFPFNGNGKAIAQGDVEGFVKVVAERRYGTLLGMHIVGPHASDLILEATLSLTLEATLNELTATVHGHPTLGETVAEAELAALGKALHLPRTGLAC